MTRTDIHAPTQMVPENYIALFFGDNGEKPDEDREVDEFTWNEQHKPPAELLARFMPELAYRGLHQCHHCGAYIRYYAILEHVPSHDTIVVGETCLERFGMTSNEFAEMRKNSADLRAQHRIKTAVKEFVDANPDLAWMANKETPEIYLGNTFLCDVAHKLRLYGYLSDRQITAVRSSMAKSAERQQLKEQEPALTSPVPNGLQQVEGIVVSLKWTPGYTYNSPSVLKALVVDDRGFKVWGSVPRSIINEIERGMRITFEATLQRSDDDETFGFFKRPKKTILLPPSNEIDPF